MHAGSTQTAPHSCRHAAKSYACCSILFFFGEQVRPCEPLGSARRFAWAACWSGAVLVTASGMEGRGTSNTSISTDSITHTCSSLGLGMLLKGPLHCKCTLPLPPSQPGRAGPLRRLPLPIPPLAAWGTGAGRQKSRYQSTQGAISIDWKADEERASLMLTSRISTSRARYLPTSEAGTLFAQLSCFFDQHAYCF